MHTMEPNLKEPVITANMEESEEDPDGMDADLQDFDTLADGTQKKTYVKCRSIRIGSYKVLMPKESVLFIPEGIRMTVPSVSEGGDKEMVTIDIPITKIVKILAHFGRCLPVFFVYVKPSVGSYIRNTLKMSDNSGLYFDPCSSDESQTRLTILPDKFIESTRLIFKDLYESRTLDDFTTDQASSSTTTQCILDEIDQKEANEILVRSSPEDKHVKAAAKKLHEKFYENKVQGLVNSKSPKERGRPGHQENKPFEMITINSSKKFGSSIKIFDEKSYLKRTLVDTKPSEQVGTRIKLVNEPIVADVPTTQREPVITVDMETDDHKDEENESEETDDSWPDFGNLLEGAIQGPHTSLKCRSLRIGSYKVLMPPENVMFVPEGIRITIPMLKADEYDVAIIDIPMKKIVKILAHFGRSLPVFFVYVKSSVGTYIRKVLKMTNQSGFYFDPCSSDESQKRLTILPDKFLETSRGIFKEIFTSASKSTTNAQVSSTEKSTHCIMEEIDQKDANELLILSSPENLPNMNVPTIRKHDEKDNSTANTKKMKADETEKSSVINPKRKKQKIIIRGEGNQPIILEIEDEYDADEEEDCDDPLAIGDDDEPVEEEMLSDLDVQAAPPPQYKKILPKDEPNKMVLQTDIRINKKETGTNERKKKEQLVASPSEKFLALNMPKFVKQNETEQNTQVPIIYSIPMPSINNSGQTVFQPIKNVQQKDNGLSPSKNDKGQDQIVQIKQEVQQKGEVLPPTKIILPPIQLAQGGTPQFIMLLPGEKTGVPVKLLKPP